MTLENAWDYSEMINLNYFFFFFQEIDIEEHSDLYKFIERLLAKMNLGFKIATSEVNLF